MMKNKYLLLPFITFALFFLPNFCFAANHYIRAGATGSNNGSSWADAWATFGAVTWTRGDTYYVAGGNYNENVVINKVTPANGWIIVKKANAADNSGNPGWNASYAKTQAVIKGKLSLNYGNVEIDGVTGSGETGHGIKIYDTDTGAFERTSYVVALDQTASAPFHLHGLDIRGAGYAASAYAQVGIQVNQSPPLKGMHISNCWIHEVTINGMTVGGFVGQSYTDYGLLFENNFVSETGGCTDPSLHGQGLQISYANSDSYFIIRNNIFRNIVGSAFIAYLGLGTHRYSRIYNNVFYITNHSIYNVCSPAVIWSAGEAGNNGGTMDHIEIYNNTFFNIGEDLSGCYARIQIESTATITEAVAKNNIWVQSYLPAGGHVGLTAKSNNDYYNNVGAPIVGETSQQTESADPFTNSAGYDFSLKSTANAKDHGLDLRNIFTTDILGNARSNVWDIGAYEYVGVSSPDITPPAAPSGLSIQ